MKEFLLKRLYGLAQIVDGLFWIFTPWKPRLGYKTALALAKHRGRKFTL